MNFSIDRHTIFFVVTGSHAYGLAIDTSDVDYRGCAIPPRNFFFGSHAVFEQWEDRADEYKTDTVIYDIRKFFRLIAEGSPTMNEYLWVPRH